MNNKTRAALTDAVLRSYSDIPEQEDEIDVSFSFELEEKCSAIVRTSSARSHRFVGRTVKIAAIAATLVLVLAVAAFAVPAVRNFVLGIEPEQTRIAAIVADESIVSVLPAYADIRLDLQLPTDAPEHIEIAYVPMLPAEHWSPTPILGEASEGNCSNTRFVWVDGNGNCVIFRQFAAPGYNGKYTIDSVNLGLNGEYTLEAKTVSDLELQAILVPPSSSEGAGGLTASDAGRAVYYWSDGNYLFALETNYDMDAALLEQIVGSVAETKDYTQFQVYLPADAPVPVSVQPVTPTCPTAIPNGWLKTNAAMQPNGDFMCYWNLKEDAQMNVIEFTQTKREAFHTGIVRDWLTTATVHTDEAVESDGVSYRIFVAAEETQIIWQLGDDYFGLVSSGPYAAGVEELLAMALSVKPEA